MGNIDKVHFIVAWLIRLILIIAAFSAIFSQNWTILFTTIFIFILTFLPFAFEKKYKIDIPIEIEIIAIIFIFATLFLGEIQQFYQKFWWWDIFLHGGSAITFGIIGVIIMYVLYKGNKIKANPGIVAVFAFCFALAIGAIWEIFEFSMDQLFGYSMQKTGLIDTMLDLVLNSIGALTASLIGYFYFKYKKLVIIDTMLDRFAKDNPDLFK